MCQCTSICGSDDELRFPEECEIYKTDLVITADLNALPKRAELINANVPVRIDRGSRQAEDSALAIGMSASLGGVAYFPVEYYSSLKSGYCVKDKHGECWVIRGRPVRRDQFPETARVRVLLEFLTITPAGIA